MSMDLDTFLVVLLPSLLPLLRLHGNVKGSETPEREATVLEHRKNILRSLGFQRISPYCPPPREAPTPRPGLVSL